MNLTSEIDGLSFEFCQPLESQEIMDALVKKLVTEYGVSAAAVWRVDGAQTRLALGAAAGQPDIPAALSEVSAHHSLLGRAVETRLPQVYEGESAVGREMAPGATPRPLRFLAAYPLGDESTVLGVLLVACARTPDDSRRALFHLHARMASLALGYVEVLTSAQRTLNRLQSMVEASKVFNSTLDLSELLGRALDVAKTLTHAERGTLFLVDEKNSEIWSLIAQGMEKAEIRLPLGRGIAGHVAQTGDIVNIPDAYADARFDPDTDKRTGFRTRNILTLPVRNKAGKIVAALQLLNKADGSFTDEDSEAVLTLSGQMAMSLENARLHRDVVEKERLEGEMALARGIQRSLLPETTPVVPGFDIAVLNEPCFEVGGDYYDFLSLGQNTLLVVVADVEGKGISSAMVMSNLQATLRALVLHLHSLNDITESVNRMILKDTRGEKYLTMFMGLIDTRRKAIHYINCGHVPPVIVRPGQEPIELREGGMVIGLFDDIQFERGHVRFQTGDILLLCTDGITEAMDTHNEEFGMQRVVACVSKTRN